jgi:DNA-binding HxlR family transcriptional regulator
MIKYFSFYSNSIMEKLNTKQPTCLPALKILSDYWTLRIINELHDGTTLRFNELERRLEGVNTATLSKRLKDMLDSGLLTRTENSRADVTYCLTDLGKQALPIFDAVNRFSAYVKNTKQNNIK